MKLPGVPASIGGLLVPILMGALVACGTASIPKPSTPHPSSSPSSPPGAEPSSGASLLPWPTGSPAVAHAVGRIAFVGSDEAAMLAVYMVDLGSGEVAKVTGPDVYPGDIAWSADGQSLAITRTICPPSPCATILSILDPATGALRDLTPIEAGVLDGEPSFSPDGQRLVFMGIRAAAGDPFRTDLFVVDVDGSSMARVALDSMTPRSPSWSSDGAWIAFSDQLAFEPSRLSVVRPDGTDNRVLLEDPNGLGHPRWAPTGDALSFTRSSDPYEVAGGQLEASLEIWVARVDGTESRPLVAYPVRGGTSAWAPDGQSIAFVGSPVGERDQLWIVSIEGVALGVVDVGGLGIQQLAWTGVGS